MEVEAKFSVPDAATLERLAATAELAGYAVAAGEIREDRDTFLDTATRRLLRAGYYLRRRESGAEVRLALKQLAAPVAGVLRREEVEASVAAGVAPAAWPQGELRERVERLVRREPLEPVLTLFQVRVARAIVAAGRVVAELSLDRVSLSLPAGGRGWFEVEVEQRAGGTDDDLEALVVALRDVWGLEPEGRAKFTHAIELAAADS